MDMRLGDPKHFHGSYRIFFSFIGIVLGLLLGAFTTLWLAPKMYPHINIPKLPWDAENKQKSYERGYAACVMANWS